MKVEVFATCDAATDNQGKLNLLGTFDQIFATNTPVVHAACAIALRVRFNKMEEGRRVVKLAVVNQDGKPVFKPVEGEVNPRMGDDVDSVAVNLILNFHQLKFESFGDYQVNLSIDNESLASLPLRVRKHPGQA